MSSLASVVGSAALGWTAPTVPATFPAAGVRRASTITLDEGSAATAAAPASPVAKLMAGLRQEYDSFFQPFLPEFYSPEVTFADPLISFTGTEKYKNNVDMLAGVTPLGKACFTDCGLSMHSVRETPSGGLQTRWTLQFRFKLLPWAPLAQFTGVSDYTLDASKRVVAQQDYWDSINLLPGGGYAPVSKLAALSDFVEQLKPGGGGAQQASDKELPYVLLRRAKGYEVRRYPQHVAVSTNYYQRIDAFGTLGAYTNGANEAQEALKAYVPSLMSVQQDARSLEQITDDSLDLKQSEKPKVMRWPMAVPALRDPTPPKPSERMFGAAALDLVPSRVVACLAFSDPTTEPIVRGYQAALSAMLRQDGLTPSDGSPEEQFRLAQFDALNSFGARRSEVWVDLADGHPWEEA